MKTALIVLPLFLVSLFHSVSARDLEISLQADKNYYAEGDTVVLGVKASIPEKFHLYSNPLGPGIGKPLILTARENENIQWVEARKSEPQKFQPPFGDWVWAYKNEARFFLKGVVTSGSTDSLKGQIRLSGLVCHNSCTPIEETLSFSFITKPDSDESGTFSSMPEWKKQHDASRKMDFSTEQNGNPKADKGTPLKTESEVSNLGSVPAESQSEEKQTKTTEDAVASEENDTGWSYSPVEKKRDFNLLTALIFSLLAGLALNITPCIFPMLGIRVLSFAQGAGESRRRAILRSTVFSMGIVAVFLLLASLAAFAGFSWGQQFQDPRVVMVIIALVFLFALGMFDFYTLLVPSNISNMENKGSGLTGDFFKGALATVLATPCGGPFLGALLAWALLQKPVVIFLIFIMIGIGMALPYVFLSTSRRFLRLLPKPGKWMEDFKHLMGFLLLGFAVHLMTGLSAGLVVTTVGICLSLAFAVGFNKRFAPFGTGGKKRILVGGVSLLVAVAGSAASVVYLPGHASSAVSDISEEGGPVWQKFTPGALKAAHKEGRSVVLNFTAAWCTSCQVNKATVLNSEKAKKIYREKDFLLMSADLTHPNEKAESLMHHLGSRSVPFLAIFPADSPQKPIIMRDNLNRKKFISALEKLP
ncbi:MAG: protein-disulfide reductase DsbD family protein [Chitinispirillaceae bacterium]